MATNTLRHVSDESKYKSFDPEGTSFPSSITNVQDALGALSQQAIDGVPHASQTVEGISRFATQDEVDDGVLDDVSVSPYTLKSVILRPPATTTEAGLTRYATDVETTNGIISDAAVVPSSLKVALTATKTEILSTQATELKMGVAAVATKVMAEAGTDDKAMMTALKTKQAINFATSQLPSPQTATTEIEGIVKIAKVGDILDGTKNNGFAVSPAGLKSLTSTNSRRGLVQLATSAEVNNGTDSEKAITPATLLARTGGINKLGLVKLTNVAGGGADATTALSAAADVVHLRGGQSINGSLAVKSLTVNGSNVVTDETLVNYLPVGAICMWTGPANRIPTNWRIADGNFSYTASSHPALWALYGSAGIPDMRGLFVRGVGAGRHITAQRGKDSKGQDKLGEGVSGGNPGQVQMQQLRLHKHDSGWGEAYRGRQYARNGWSYRMGYYGSGASDFDNYSYFTNDGSEIGNASQRGVDNTMNPEGLMGKDNRPWNMSVYYIIKVK